MTRLPILITLMVAGLLGFLTAGALAQESGPPPADATPGAPGVTGPVLGFLDPVVAPGYQLRMVETVFAPGSYVTRHTHPTTIIVCVQSGALGFAIQEGAATITRGGGDEEPESTEPLEVDTEAVLEPQDCVAFDHFAHHTVHTAWNASDETTVLWEAQLYKSDEPFTTFVDAMGTPCHRRRTEPAAGSGVGSHRARVTEFSGRPRCLSQKGPCLLKNSVRAFNRG